MTRGNPDQGNLERMERLCRENRLNTMDVDEHDRPIGGPLEPATE